MKPVDADSFQIRKYARERGKEKNDDFDMDILEEGDLEKAPDNEKETPEEKSTENNI